VQTNYDRRALVVSDYSTIPDSGGGVAEDRAGCGHERAV